MSVEDVGKLADVYAEEENVDEKDKKKEMIPLNKFFTYMTGKDKVLLVIGGVSAVIAGAIVPCMAIAMGEITNTFDPRVAPDEVLDQMAKITLYICLVGIGSWVFGYIYYAFWQHLAQNISFDLRSRYLKAILRQEVAYFEKNNVE